MQVAHQVCMFAIYFEGENTSTIGHLSGHRIQQRGIPTLRSILAQERWDAISKGLSWQDGTDQLLHRRDLAETVEGSGIGQQCRKE